MTSNQEKKLLTLLSQIAKEWPDETVTQWALKNIVFREPGISGPMSLYGRKYMEEVIDLWRGPQVSDLILCWGSRTGKTRTLLIGAAWRIVHHPMRCLWCKPALHGPGGARNDARTKWIPMLQASPQLAALLPTQYRRSDMTFLQQIIAGSIIDWTGTGSARQLAGNPCDVTIQDEIDGYVHRGDVEAHPSALIDERTKDCPLPMRVKTSTPTIEDGMIWQWLMRSDLRRRFVPCPYCSEDGKRKDRYFVLGWSETVEILPRVDDNKQEIPVAWVHWDNENDIGDDPDPEDIRIAAETAHFVCPHCGAKISDEHKLWMDAHGEWRPTRKAVPGIRGYHLPSLYASHPETSLAKLTIKYLSSRANPDVLRNFINSDLALPWAAQDAIAAARVIVEKPEATQEGKWTRLMTVDCQQSWPYFWWVIRAWRADGENRGDSILIAQGHADTWEELTAIQAKYGVANSGVMVDSGYGARENAEVYRECFRRATKWLWQSPSSGRLLDKPVAGARIFPRDGWLAAKGFPSRKRWKSKTGEMLPYRLHAYDPFHGTADQGKYGDYLFEFSGDYFLDLLELLRSGKAPETWAVSDGAADKEYWRHMEGKMRDSGGNWVKRSRRWPDHLADCEKMQVAFAYYLGLLRGAPQADQPPHQKSGSNEAGRPDTTRQPIGSSG